MKTETTKNKIKVKADSNIAKILRGETKGYFDWYVKEIMQNSNLYIVENYISKWNTENYKGIKRN